jgi:FkbM family methyltransferase
MATSPSEFFSKIDPFVLVDIGASQGISRTWDRPELNLVTVGFEPNTEEFNKLNQTKDRRWVNAGLAGQTGPRTLYITKGFTNTSLLRPNFPKLAEVDFGDGHTIASELSIHCVTLQEALAGMSCRPDFIKVDTQGTELEILKGGQAFLQNDVVGVEVEVEHFPIYENQPLFAEVDVYMRSLGFELHDLGNFLYLKSRSHPRAGGPKGKIISCDAVYFKSLERILALPTGQRLQKARALLIAYYVYGYSDFGLSALDRLASLLPPEEQTAWRQIFSGQAAGLSRFRRLPGGAFAERVLRRLAGLIRPVKSALWVAGLGNS